MEPDFFRALEFGKKKHHFFYIFTLRNPLSKSLLLCSVYFTSKKSDVVSAVLKKPRSSEEL